MSKALCPYNPPVLHSIEKGYILSDFIYPLFPLFPLYLRLKINIMIVKIKFD
jgi:hypothetical protein